METSPPLRATDMEILDNQLRENTPPETKETYERLLAEGNSMMQTRELIASVMRRSTHRLPDSPVDERAKLI